MSSRGIKIRQDIERDLFTCLWHPAATLRPSLWRPNTVFYLFCLCSFKSDTKGLGEAIETLCVARETSV